MRTKMTMRRRMRRRRWEGGEDCNDARMIVIEDLIMLPMPMEMKERGMDGWVKWM